MFLMMIKIVLNNIFFIFDHFVMDYYHIGEWEILNSHWSYTDKLFSKLIVNYSHNKQK